MNRGGFFGYVLIMVLTTSPVLGIWSSVYAQPSGSMHHNGREHHEDWPDSLQTITISGRAIVDSSHLHPLYFVDVEGDAVVDYQLGFGPYWYEPASGASRPLHGDEIAIVGGLIDDHVPPLIAVFEINGLAWRDSSGAPPWSGGWVHRDASDTSFVYCPTDSLDWMGYPPLSMHGMMWPDSIYCQFEEIPVDSLPGARNPTLFEGYYTENFRSRGGHMRGSGMMMGFSQDINFQFHYDEGELARRGLSESSIKLHYLDGNLNWQVSQRAAVDTEANIVYINESEVRTFYALGAGSVTSVENQNVLRVPEHFTLLQNFPNPFNPRTTVRYELQTDLEIELAVYDVLGRKVQELYSGRQEAGAYSVIWDGTDHANRSVASGSYLIELRSGNESRVRRVVLLR